MTSFSNTIISSPSNDWFPFQETDYDQEVGKADDELTSSHNIQH